MATINNPAPTTCPEIYDLALELRQPDTSLTEFFTKLDDDQRISIRNPKYRCIYFYVFLILDQLSTKIKELDYRFDLTFSPTCGSAFEDTKVGRPDEFDVLVLLEPFCGLQTRFSSWDTSNKSSPQLTVEDPVDDQWVDLIESDGSHHRLNPAKLHHKFTSLLDEAMEYVRLPNGFTHGGFASPRYSGVRPHRFAHLIQLIYSSSPGDNFIYDIPLFLTIDLTLVVKAPVNLTFEVLSRLWSSGLLGHFFVQCLNGSSSCDHQTQADFSRLLLYNRQCATNMSPDLNDDPGIYMIPSRDQGWVLTTAGLDHKFTNLFSGGSQLKRCIRVCKILRNKFLTLAEYKLYGATTNRNDAEARYRSYLKLLNIADHVPSRPNTSAYDFLVQYLQSSSETIQPDHLHKMNEFTPPMCSASSGFIKYLPLRILSQRGLTEDNFKDSPQVDPELVLEVISSMGPEKEGAPHIILPKNVLWPVSMHKFYSSNSMTADYLMRAWHQRYIELMGVLMTTPK